jgi:hypothetical protein
VTIRRDLDWMFGFITLIHSTRNYKYYSAIANHSTLQFTATNTSICSLLQPSLSVSLQRILTQELTVSLSYTLKISLYYSTHKVFSSQKTFNTTELHSIILMQLLCSQAHIVAGRRLETQLSIIFYCRLKRLPKSSSQSSQSQSHIATDGQSVSQ